MRYHQLGARPVGEAPSGADHGLSDRAGRRARGAARTRTDSCSVKSQLQRPCAVAFEHHRARTSGGAGVRDGRTEHAVAVVDLVAGSLHDPSAGRNRSSACARSSSCPRRTGLGHLAPLGILHGVHLRGAGHAEQEAGIVQADAGAAGEGQALERRVAGLRVAEAVDALRRRACSGPTTFPAPPPRRTCRCGCRGCT